MHHKRHALELLELFKQSRQTARPEALPDRVEVKPDLPREEVMVAGIGRLGAERAPASTPTTSYLPKITPAQRSANVVNVRKDTIIVGAVFIVVFAGLSFLLGRRTGMLASPRIEAQTAPLSLVDEPLALVEPFAVKKATVAQAPLAAAPEAEQPAAIEVQEPKTEAPAYTHEYQVATTFDDQKSAEEYREFLIGNKYDAFIYLVTSKGWWTVRVRSNDATENDLEEIKHLSFRGRYPFDRAFSRQKQQ